MIASGRTLGIRQQLLGLFALMLVASVGVLVLDEWERRSHVAALAQLKDESLGNLRRIKAVSDAYGLDYVDTTFRVRNGLMSWQEGIQVVDGARHRIDAHWRTLEEVRQSEEQANLIAQINGTRVAADAAAMRLRGILQRRDMAALARFADTELYPAIDPVTSRLKYFSDLQLIEADRRAQASVKRARDATLLRVALILGGLALFAAIAQRIVRNIYKGVESLRDLSQQMRRHDYNAVPRFRAEGELGEVLDGFLIMRDDVRRFENELNEQLLRNERVRASLQQSEVFQRSLFAAARVAVMSLDLEGHFTSFNPFAEKLTGYRAEELNGKRRIDPLFLPGTIARVAPAKDRGPGPADSRRRGPDPGDDRAGSAAAGMDHRAQGRQGSAGVAGGLGHARRDRQDGRLPGRRHRPDRHQAAGKEAALERGRRARGQHRQEQLPGGDEPRDPHADDRRHRHAGSAGA